MLAELVDPYPSSYRNVLILLLILLGLINDLHDPHYQVGAVSPEGGHRGPPHAPGDDGGLLDSLWTSVF